MPDSRANSAAGTDRESDRPLGAQPVRVMLPLPLPAPLDYLVPDGAAVPEPGSFVRVSLGSRRVIGVVWDGAGEESGEESGSAVPVERLKPITEILPTPKLRPELRRFVERVAAYTLSAPGAVLRMAMSVEEALLPPPPRLVCAATPAGLAALAEPSPQTPLTAARRRVLETLRDGSAWSIAEAARRAGCGAGVVRGLIAAGHVGERLMPGEPRPLPQGAWDAAGPKLSPDQEAAASRLVERTGAGGFSVTVLDGVTGSGKTETYFAAIAAALVGGRQVLVLLPEIALGAQWLDRFRRRFGAMPVEWHSDVSQTARRDAWRAVASARARIVVGARSALFLPFPELGLIVVDEEHDPSYKQEDGVCYQARDMAVLRASLAQIPIVLVSATPSLETVVNIARGRYERVHLPRRHAEASLPTIALVDMRKERVEPGRFMSAPLVEALGRNLAGGEQSLLFLNRRGYAPLTLCRACGHRMQCPSCTAWLVEHRYTGRLLCHHCGYAARVPALCPECLTAGTLVPCGPGVERLREEVAARFPTARIALMVSDLLSGPRAAADLADAMVAQRYDVLIGTQIVAKGHHFPMLTLVGVVDADLGLTGGDLRAAFSPPRRMRGGRRGCRRSAGWPPSLSARAIPIQPISRLSPSRAPRRSCPASAYWAPPPPRWRSCAGAIGGAFSSRPSAMSICKRCCATGSVACGSAARPASRSMSTRTAFCKGRRRARMVARRDGSMLPTARISRGPAAPGAVLRRDPPRQRVVATVLPSAR